MRQLTGRTALITGTSRGIGTVIAAALAREGMNLALVARSAPELEDVAEQLRAGGVRVLAVPADLGALNELPELVARIAADMGPIDVLVNNASTSAARSTRPAVPKTVRELSGRWWT